MVITKAQLGGSLGRRWGGWEAPGTRWEGEPQPFHPGWSPETVQRSKEGKGALSAQFYPGNLGSCWRLLDWALEILIY